MIGIVRRAVWATGHYRAGMQCRLISSGSSFEHEIGYSRAVVVGDRAFVSGTTGFDYATMTISEDVVMQTGQCIRNIEAALHEANCSLRDDAIVGSG